MTAEPTWTISSRVAFVISSPERVVALHLDRPQEQPVALTGTAAAIWLLLSGESGQPPHRELALPQIVDDLADTYDAPADAIRPDIVAFLDEMTESAFLARLA